MTPNEVAAALSAAVHTIDCDIALISLVMPGADEERREVTTGLMISAQRQVQKSAPVEALVSSMDAVAGLLERQDAAELAELIRGWMEQLTFVCQSKLIQSIPVKNDN